MQTTQQILMIRPARFSANPQTLASNAFQHPAVADELAASRAQAEFDAYVALLREAGVSVWVEQDSGELATPDSLFPNNWVSFHADGSAILYPMEAPNRRLERNRHILDKLAEAFCLEQVHDLSDFEQQGRFLEGTGSMVLDRQHRIAYLCRSSRSHPEVMEEVSRHLGYRPFWFSAQDAKGQPIYHTNVLMSVGRHLAVVCLEAIPDAAERAELCRLLASTNKMLLPITLDQLQAFAGNLLELRSDRGEALLAMSRRAWEALSQQQQRELERHGRPLLADLDTIETLGGGGARCMIAEIHLPQREPVRAEQAA